MPTTAPTIASEDLPELLHLIEGADSVELKLTVSETEQRSAIEALGLDPLDAQIRQVFFFDTPDLALDGAGVVVRARRVQRKGDDTVVKLRPVIPVQLPGHVRNAETFGVEVDAMPGGFVCSGSFKGAVAAGRVRETVTGRRRLQKLFSKEQRAFFAEHAPEGVTFDDLAVLGPIFVLKLKVAPAGFGHKLAVEFWLYPDESRILELSTKCEPADAFRVAAEARAFLTERGIDLSGEQATKTRRALEYFAARRRRDGD
jgi:hypothetical protein